MNQTYLHLIVDKPTFLSPRGLLVLLHLALNRLLLASATLTLVTWSFTPVFSQDRIENTSFAQAGDTIYFFTDDLPKRVSITPSGPNQTWNYANLNAPFLEYRIISPADRGQQADRYPEAELVSQSSDGDEMYIDVRNDGIWELGGKKGSRLDDQIVVNFIYEDGLPLQLSKMAYGQDLDYEDKMIEQCALDDLPSHQRNKLSTKLDSLRFTTNLSRNITVDAYGKLILPGARYDVVRARVEDYLSMHLEGKRGGNSWSELSEDEVARLKKPTRQVRYLFIRVSDGKLLAQVMTGVDGQPTRVEYTMPAALTRYFKPANPGQWMYAYPNPAFTFVRFKFMDVLPGEYTIHFYNILGKSLMEVPAQLEGSSTVEVNVGHLNKGTYLYSLIDPQGKKLITKRLVILKP